MGPPPRASKFRFVILSLTTLVAVMLYLDRWCLGFVARYITDELRLERWQTDVLQGAFFLTYAFGQIPCGWLADRHGARRMLTLYLFVWSVLTGLMGLAHSFAALLLFRLGCGLFESGAYPACAGLIRRWSPESERGLASSIVSIGGRLGGTIAFPLTAFLMLSFVPASAPSRFEPDDLLDMRAFAREVSGEAPRDPDKSPALAPYMAPRVRAALPEDVVRMVSAWSARARSNPKDKIDPTPEEAERLAAGLNAALARDDLARGTELGGTELERFRAVLPEEALELAASPGPLSAEQLARLNRLVLEAAFPDALRKLYGDGWRPTLGVYGAAGVLLAALFWLFFRDRPREHSLVNAAEVRLIEGEAKDASRHTPTPHDGPAEDPAPTAGQLWRGILASPSLWLSCFVQFGTNFSWAFLGTKLPEYLDRVHGVPATALGWMTALPFALALPMMILGGWWSDRLTRTWGRRPGRAIPLGTTRIAAGLAFLACLLLQAPWPVTLALCAMSVLSDMGLPAIWAYNLDVSGKNVGLVLGWGNMWGNLGAAAAPFVIGRIQEYAGWNAVFLTCGLVFLVIGVASFGIDATRPIAPVPDGAGADGPAGGAAPAGARA